jgi:RND family efflux transporter MFP subunit
MCKRPLLIICGSLLLTSACSSASVEQAEADVRTVIVSRALGASEAADTVIGTVRSVRMDMVSSEQGGKVLALLADVGDRVVAGQVLARLDASAQVLRAEAADAEKARAAATAAERSRNADRLRQIAADGTASPSDLEAALAEAEAARAALRAAEAQARLAQRDRSLTLLRAPASGVVAARPAHLSAVLAPGAPVFEIESAGERRISASLPARIAERIQPGQHVRFRIGESMGEARLVGVSARESGAGGREATFAVIAGTVSPGAVVEVLLPGRATQGGAQVPQAAILESRDGTRRILVVTPNKSLRSIPVRLVSLSGANALIEGQLAAGDLIVAAGGEFLQPGQRVRPVFANR